MKLTGSELANFSLNSLQGKIDDFSNQCQSQEFCKFLGAAIKQDAELNGQFPFLFTRLKTLSDPAQEANGIAITKCAEGAAEFCSVFCSNWEGEPAEISLGSIKELLNRSNQTFDDERIYGALFAYLLGIGLIDINQFVEGHVFNALPRFKVLLAHTSYRLQSGGVLWADLRNLLKAELAADQSRQFVQRSLGGMLELGNVKQDTLWRAIFRRDSPTDAELQAADSLQRYYIGYRFSSVRPEGVLSKSFIVLQSPGNATGKVKGFREHFAIKAFTRTLTGRVHVSAGAIVSLGSKLACFGSRRWLEDDEAVNKERQFSGAKSLFLNLKCFDDNGEFLTGHVLVTNSENETISANMIFVETDIDHSDKANMGPLPIDGFADDFLDSTKFTSSGELTGEQKSQLAEILIPRMSVRVPKAYEGASSGLSVPIMAGHDSCSGDVAWELSRLGVTTDLKGP